MLATNARKTARRTDPILIPAKIVALVTSAARSWAPCSWCRSPVPRRADRTVHAASTSPRLGSRGKDGDGEAIPCSWECLVVRRHGGCPGSCCHCGLRPERHGRIPDRRRCSQRGAVGAAGRERVRRAIRRRSRPFHGEARQRVPREAGAAGRHPAARAKRRAPVYVRATDGRGPARHGAAAASRDRYRRRVRTWARLPRRAAARGGGHGRMDRVRLRPDRDVHGREPLPHETGGGLGASRYHDRWRGRFRKLPRVARYLNNLARS
jgi:hypothetical protein